VSSAYPNMPDPSMDGLNALITAAKANVGDAKLVAAGAKEIEDSAKQVFGDPNAYKPASAADVVQVSVDYSASGDNADADLKAGSLHADTASMRKYAFAMRLHAAELGTAASDAVTGVHVSAGDFLEAANLAKQSDDLIGKVQAGIGAWQTNVEGTGDDIVRSAQSFDAGDKQAGQQIRS
jgi:hypothetical protein